MYTRIDFLKLSFFPLINRNHRAQLRHENHKAASHTCEGISFMKAVNGLLPGIELGRQKAREQFPKDPL